MLPRVADTAPGHGRLGLTGSPYHSAVERYFTGARFSGGLLLPGDPRFEEARRVWNGMIDRTPALIAYCRDTSDVKRLSALPGRLAVP
jgi:hypothetical protein